MVGISNSVLSEKCLIMLPTTFVWGSPMHYSPSPTEVHLHRALDFPAGSTTIMRNPRASLPLECISRMRPKIWDYGGLEWILCLGLICPEDKITIERRDYHFRVEKLAFCCSYRSRVKPKSIFKHLKFLSVLTECDVDVCVPYLTKICTIDFW